MRKGMKKIFALMLSMAMGVSMFSFEVSASGSNEMKTEGTETEVAYGKQITDNLQNVITAEEAYVNPLYDHVIQVSDLKDSSASYNAGIAAAENTEYCTSIEEAAEMVRNGMKERQESIEVGLETSEVNQNMTKDEIVDVIVALAKEIALQAMEHTGNAVEGDYLKWQYAGWKCSPSCQTQGNKGMVTFPYTFTYYTTTDQESKVDTEVDKVLNSLNLDGKSNYVKIKGIYDYICENVTYDNKNVDDDDYKLKYTAYAALINKTAVCQGYAVLFYRFALELGVDARLIAGTGNGESHAWNIAVIDSKYYNLDSTWDAGKTEYRYFLKCNDNFGNHVRSDDYTTAEFNKTYPMSSEDYEPDAENPFEDVSKEDYYYNAVLWALKNGITEGVDETHFAPGSSCTRGQVVTFLWRAEGKPEAKTTECSFEDVTEGDYYYKAVLWASENGITNGVDETHFAPNQTVTRSQVVTFLHRAKGKTAPSLTSNPFEDVSENAYYTDAVLWAYENGITEGVDETHFAPERVCNRGQVVTFLYRTYEG